MSFLLSLGTSWTRVSSFSCWCRFLTPAAQAMWNKNLTHVVASLPGPSHKNQIAASSLEKSDSEHSDMARPHVSNNLMQNEDFQQQTTETESDFRVKQRRRFLFVMEWLSSCLSWLKSFMLWVRPFVWRVRSSVRWVRSLVRWMRHSWSARVAIGAEVGPRHLRRSRLPRTTKTFSNVSFGRQEDPETSVKSAIHTTQLVGGFLWNLEGFVSQTLCAQIHAFSSRRGRRLHTTIDMPCGLECSYFHHNVFLLLQSVPTSTPTQPHGSVMLLVPHPHRRNTGDRLALMSLTASSAPSHSRFIWSQSVSSLQAESSRRSDRSATHSCTCVQS